MKAGARVLGVAESFSGRHDDDAESVLAGALVRPDRVVEDFAFGTCSVGGTDATDAVATLFARLDREDVRCLLVAGVAPAWFNVVDLGALAAAVDRPVLSVSFEDSEGLEPAIREQFDGPARERRLATYRALPSRRPVALGTDGEGRDHRVFVRAVGVDHERAREVVRSVTPEGGRPEPLRVARQAARAVRRFRNQE